MTKTKKKVSKKAVAKPKKKTVVKKATKKKPVKKAAAKKTTKKKAVKKTTTKPKKKAVAKKASSKKVAKKVVKKTKTVKNKKKTVKKVSNSKSATKKPVKRKTSKKTDFSNDLTSLFDNTVDEPQIDNKGVRFNKIPILQVIIVVLAALLLISVILLFKNGVISFNSNTSKEESIIRTLPKEADPIYKQTWQEFHDKTYVADDYIGQIIFESGIINEPVLQGDTNETYLRRNYETYKYEVCGPVFMDYICNAETDQNLILYGHNRSTSVDPEHVMLFSPLHTLEKEENYDKNKLIYLAYENRFDIYLVASVYPVKVVEKEDGYQYLVEGEPLYYLNNYSPEQFDTYLRAVKQKQFYDTGVELVNTDELLTLQTCYEDKLDKLIVLAKKIGSTNYKED